MEIEAKFTVPDQATFQRLLQVDRLAGFRLSTPRLKRLHDQYLDTAHGAFLRGGYACRLRSDGDGRRLLTLKSLTAPQGLMHVRQELEVQLPPQASLDVAAWPASEATALARQLSQDQPLEAFFDLRQARYKRLAAAGEGEPPRVELSIDHVRFSAAAEHDYLGVEAELLPAGDLDSLQAIAGELGKRWGLSSEPTSKFERGLALARPELLSFHFANRVSHE